MGYVLTHPRMGVLTDNEGWTWNPGSIEFHVKNGPRRIWGTASSASTYLPEIEREGCEIRADYNPSEVLHHWDGRRWKAGSRRDGGGHLPSGSVPPDVLNHRVDEAMRYLEGIVEDLEYHVPGEDRATRLGRARIQLSSKLRDRLAREWV